MGEPSVSSASQKVSESLSVSPVIQFPKEAETGKTYLLTVDLSPHQAFGAWPYANDEEVAIYCLVNAAPLFTTELLGEPAVVIHRFGGTYGPARFLITATAEPQEGVIRITLVSGMGVPLTTFETPLISVRDKVERKEVLDLRVRRRNAEADASPASIPTVGIPTPKRPDAAARIFISSTYADLREYQQAAYRELRSMGHEVILLEDQFAKAQFPLDKSYEEIASCDLYVGIFGWHYGYIPSHDNPDQKSIVELEYRRALAYGKPCIIFLLDENALRFDTHLETGPGARKIEALRTELISAHVVNFVNNADQLGTQVGTAVNQWLASKSVDSRVDYKAPVALSPDHPSTRRLPRSGRKKSIRRSSFAINLKSSKVVIAIAQLAGPFPNGKHKTVINDRETLGWMSLGSISERIDKASSVLDQLSKVTLKPDIVVFPEYSIPVQKALPDFQKKADEYGFIILGGADTILQPNSFEVFNQSPIIIPGRKRPIWIKKHVLSQWERGLVDEPDQPTQILLTWEIGRQKFWISMYITLDFSQASAEFKHGGGLFLVPMCSPDVMSFIGWADSLLRLEGGTATVLCNCVGEGATGQSSVVAVNLDSKPFQAAFALSTTKEQVAVLEIDLQHLSLPKKTSRQLSYPLGRRFVYDLEVMPEGVQLRMTPVTDNVIRKHAVINPAIIDLLGKKMRIAFLKVPNYAEIERNVIGKEYEVLAVMGNEDLMVTHLAADSYDMLFDVTQTINWIGIKGNTVTPQDLDNVDEDNFPYFRVDTYYKVMGLPVSENDQAIFGSRDKPLPTFAEIASIFKLSERWEDPDVTDGERTRFLKNRWILDINETSSGGIEAVMTFRLQYSQRDNKSSLLAKFDKIVVPELIKTSQVKSLYRGTSTGLDIDYIARLIGDFDSVSNLQDQLHKLAMNSRIIIDIKTLIVRKKLSSLSLPRAVLVTNLSRDKHYRDRRIMPYLSNDDRVRMAYQSEKEQLEFIDLFRPVDDSLERIEDLSLEEDEKKVMRRKLVSGLFNYNFDDLMEIHHLLQIRVERILMNFIKDNIDETNFSKLKAKENIQTQKLKSQLSYSDRIKIVTRYIEDTSTSEDTSTGEDTGKSEVRWSSVLSSVTALSETIKVRNALAHYDTERISLAEFTATIVNYCNFLYDWNENITEMI